MLVEEVSQEAEEVSEAVFRGQTRNRGFFGRARRGWGGRRGFATGQKKEDGSKKSVKKV